MNTIKQNPVTLLSTKYNEYILECRKDVYLNLYKISPDCSSYLEAFIKNKIDNSSEIPTPALGEIYPWFITDAIGQNLADIKLIVEHWYCFYYHSLILDSMTDEVNFSEKKIALLTSSLLAKNGFIGLSSVSNRIGYIQELNEYLDRGYKSQIDDVKFNSDPLAKILHKANYTVGKNNIIFSCSLAIIEKFSYQREIILESTNELLLIGQYLDDLLDYQDDYNNKNYTLLLNLSISSASFFKKECLDGDELLELLVLSGKFDDYLFVIQKSLNNLDSLLSKNNAFESVPLEFTKALNLKIDEFRTIVKDYSQEPLKEKLPFIRKYIEIVGQLT